ncbi:uncharacterized protein A4U43_C04F15620 [Asparagus officinalis]|uniref:Uncharacterized protein n=1 Tax=Asparagus officinalis TaxID=4686 RepID=A0A5P1F5Z1_ASPOF|nr:uncharacterized protein LOC109837368 [Asparagus officinalis]ONK72091.1 uncharacterized protein A4U43_C04F15620 [Asparagus officinalis]
MRSSIAEKPLFLAVAAYTLIADARSSAAFESDGSSSLPSPLLAARAIRASAAHRDASSVSSAYDEPLAGAGNRNPKHHEILHLRHSPEITAFSDRYSEFEKLNTKVLGVSVDSMYSVVHSDRHLADHFGGKLHLGYMQIREKLAEMQDQGGRNMMLQQIGGVNAIGFYKLCKVHQVM